MNRALLMRIVIILGLTVLLLVPLGMIEGVVRDRQGLQAQVEQAIAASAAGSQRLVGPVLVVPYTEQRTDVVTDDKGKQTRKNTALKLRAIFAPEQLSYDGDATVETRYKGIYKVLAFQHKLAIAANFQVPVNLGLEADPKTITPGKAYLAFGLSDVRGLRGSPLITIDGKSQAALSGAQLDVLGDGIHADAGDITLDHAKSLAATLKFSQLGTNTLSIAPVGKNTLVTLHSSWPHPNFGGRFLPISRQIDDSGFSAKWEIPYLATRNSALISKGVDDKTPLEMIDVSFIEPVNIYQQSERAVKYGILFIVLIFAAFFLFETLKELRIHPMQYALVGMALAIFFLLLISLSEHIQFAFAYLIASVACVVLIGFYVAHVLHGWRRGAFFTAALSLLFATLYMLLLSEDYALLMGALLLFIVLAAIMVVTRKVNWYQVGS